MTNICTLGALIPLLLMSVSSSIAVTSDNLGLGLDKLYWDMSPQQARDAYPELTANTTRPGTWPPTNLGSLFLDNYEYAGCTFAGVLRFEIDKLKGVELTEIAPGGPNPPCKAQIEAEFARQYGVTAAYHERSEIPSSEAYLFSGVYGRYRGKVTGAFYQSTPGIEISFGDRANPPSRVIIYDVQQQSISPGPSRQKLSFALAMDAAQAAFDVCNRNGSAATVEVFGLPPSYPTAPTGGPLEVLFSADDAPYNAFEGARRKAYAVYLTNMASGDYANSDYAKRNPKSISSKSVDGFNPFQTRPFPNVLAEAGALPIMQAGSLVGVISVFGVAGPATDEICAQAGLDKIKDRLPKPQ